MTLAIIGSRTCPPVDIEAYLDEIPDAIVSGGAKGADSYANRVNDHKQKKDWWDTALVFVSKLSGIYASEANCSEQRQGFLPVKRDRNACQKGAFCTAIVT